MKIGFAERNLIAELRALFSLYETKRSAQVKRIARTLALAALFLTVMASAVWAQSNPGDPLFCRPNEGVQFLIVNGGAGVFSVDPDCFSNNLANDTINSITTGQGGTLTRVGVTGSYIYAPPTPNFTGLDTFSIAVTTVYNSAGGVGSAGGTASPGGPATLNITLNVIPATTALTVAGVATLVPVPAGSLSGCSLGGNSGVGPAAGTQWGCITGIVKTGAAPSHGTLSTSGNTILYTPTPGYLGPDSFSYQALGTNVDGPSSLNSGTVTVQVTVAQQVPALGAWGMAILCVLLVLFGAKTLVRRPV
jgi:hypothetical protein